MKRLKIIKKEEYNYTLEDDALNKYDKNITFYNIDSPNVGDYLYMTDNVLKEVNIFSYGKIDDSNMDNISKDELIKVETKDKEYYLKRLYG